MSPKALLLFVPIALAPAATVYAATPESLGFLDNTNVTISENHAAGAFSDQYTFTLQNPGSILGGVVSFSFAPIVDISGLSVTLTGPNGTSANATQSAGSFFFNSVPAGLFSFDVSGVATGSLGGAYSGNIGAVTAAVPEPESYLLALVGIAGVAWGRKRMAKSIAHRGTAPSLA